MKLNWLLKWLIPAPVAAGSVCLTMKLTNQANTPLLSIGGLEVGDAPQLTENEIKPTEKHVPPAQKPPAKPGGSENGEGGEQSPSAEGSPGDSSPSSTGSQSTDKRELKEVIQEQIKDINTQSPTWIARPTELTSIYSVFSKIAGLLSNLQVFKQEAQKAAEAKSQE